MSRSSFNMVDDGDQPPPYSSALDSKASSSHSPYTPPVSACEAQNSSFLFSAQLSSLRSQILEEQAARSSTRDQQDIEILSRIVPHVEALLNSIASYNPPPALVEATFVPDAAIGPEWVFSDSEQNRSDEMRELIRVEREVKLDGDKKQPRQAASRDAETSDSKEFDEWGRWSDDGEHRSPEPGEDLWWSDEDMAERLAKHLRPVRATASVDRQTVRAQVERDKAARAAGRWSMFRKDEPARTSPTASSSKTQRKPLDDVNMTVNAEETTFRRQNEMGIWESRTGWGLVVRVTLRRT
ncbi:hypothetical protein NOR_05333 [Metarhizium rileyi]|uniref:NAD dependent epimerase/dehydratase family protein n=1 Tax=Metarhizium rileyi (strain RCEF 4871) TaxID=1649241 RepID=A0A167CJ81_METRR|nr:hypothetical protein NOR_05333 [Metarhizium rileyi RCEF 4871]